MKDDTQHSELPDLAIRKLSGEATPQDLTRLAQLLTDEENQFHYEKLEKIWERAELARGLTASEMETEWQRLKSAVQKKEKQKFSPFLRIAASVALLAGIGFAAFYFLKEDQTTIIAQQQLSKILDDGSAVTLNAGAELRYSEDFNTEKREVQLEGEAYFEVERNPDRPFVIRTPTIEVTVVGTSFLVKDKAENSSSEVVVVSGIVEVGFQDKTIRLEATEKAILNKGSGQLFKVTNEDANFLSWKTKEFTFEDLPLHEVVALLNNAYQADLYLENEKISDCPITVSFQNQTLEAILEVLKATLDLSIRKTKKGTALRGEGC